NNGNNGNSNKKRRDPFQPPQGQGGDQGLGGNQGPGNSRRWILFLIPLLILLPLITTMFSGGTQQPTVSYTEFRDQVSNGNVQQVVISGNRVEGTFEQPPEDGGGGLRGQDDTFVTYVPAFGDQDIIQLLQENNVTVYTQPERDNMSFLTVLFNLLPLLLLLWIGWSIYRNMRSQGRGIFNVGENKAKLYDKKEGVKTTFEDVAGLEGAKDEVTEIVDYLKNPDAYTKIGAETPRGILLVGPPGTGKTLVARAIAGEAGVPFYSMSGSDFMEMFVGVGASRVRNLFKDAKAKSPSIIFIDELDSIGRHRGAGLGGGHDEREQTLNQLLSELDGFEPNESTIVLAATNRPDILDPALLRPGRFDRRVLINLPTVKDREAILKVHSKKRPLADDVDLAKVAQSTPGFSGADLENLLNEASIVAARAKKETVNMADIDEARDKVLLGLQRRGITMSEEEKKTVSYHESGHALTAAFMPNTDPIYKVTIIPRDKAMGVTQQMPATERYLYSKNYLNDRLVVMLGGRAAEELIFGDVTTGAENDFREATKLARRMVSDWGMSKLGPLASSGEQRNVFLGEELSRGREFSEHTAQEIDAEIKRILNEAYDRAVKTLKDHRKELDRLATRLLEKEDLEAEEIMELLGLSKNGEKGNETVPSDGEETTSEDGSAGKRSAGRRTSSKDSGKNSNRSPSSTDRESEHDESSSS
ncbi:MAG: ATP-dependent zinc metalloprotease FtsH, partial [Spirochaetaceae bacterium]